MNALFLKIVNMSISASWLVLAVLILRLVLKKAPKWVSVLLWGIVAVRLICPFSIESVLSLIPSAETIPLSIEMDMTPAIDSGVNALNNVVNPVISASFTPQPQNSANPLQIVIPAVGILWLAGMAVMLLYTAISYWHLRRRVATAVLLQDNVYQSEQVASPFVLGMIKPKIYLPFRMEGQTPAYVLAHEQAHIRRKDHLWKPLGFLLLTVHWFNPLMWLAYIFLCRDIELACDEKVIRELGSEERADYTQALVACSISRRSIAACPLAFGEVGVKDRVKSVMNYKKPAFWIIVAAVITCIAVAVCFLTDPVAKPGFDERDIKGTIDAGYELENAVTLNAEVLLLQKDGGFWEFEKGQEVDVFISFENDGSSMSMKTVGYIYCGDGTEQLYAEKIFSNQDVGQSNGSFKAPESGCYLFYFRNYSASWIDLKSFVVKDQPYFQAAIVDVYDGYFLVEPAQGSSERKSADRIEVPIRNMDPGLEPQIGDLIEISYNGQIQETYPARLAEVYSIQLVDQRKILSLDDVIILSQKGYDLSWRDFDQFKYTETGSGLYIRVYEINRKFQLWIGGGGPDSEPMYIYLVLNDDIDIRIDIRDGGVTEFISTAKSPEEKWARIPMVMVDGIYYVDTGYESDAVERTDHFDGEITSSVDGSGRPYDNDQSNFGTGYGYQYGKLNGTLEIYIDGKWRIFAQEEVRQQMQHPDQGEYYLTVGAKNVVLIEIELPGFSGGCENANGRAYRKGERIWLESISGMADLRGLEITAYDEEGNIVWTASVPDTEENTGFTHLTQDDWIITNLK